MKGGGSTCVQQQSSEELSQAVVTVASTACWMSDTSFGAH